MNRIPAISLEQNQKKEITTINETLQPRETDLLIHKHLIKRGAKRDTKASAAALYTPHLAEHFVHLNVNGGTTVAASDAMGNHLKSFAAGNT